MRRVFIVCMFVCMAVFTMQAKGIPQPQNPNKACEEAWNDYRKANALWITGWCLFSVGVASGVMEGLVFPMTAFNSGPNVETRTSTKVVMGLMGVSSGMIVASVPCLIVGQINRKAALKTYREQCTSESSLTFDFRPSGGGIGIAMNF